MRVASNYWLPIFGVGFCAFSKIAPRVLSPKPSKVGTEQGLKRPENINLIHPSGSIHENYPGIYLDFSKCRKIRGDNPKTRVKGRQQEHERQRRHQQKMKKKRK